MELAFFHFSRDRAKPSQVVGRHKEKVKYISFYPETETNQ